MSVLKYPKILLIQPDYKTDSVFTTRSTPVGLGYISEIINELGGSSKIIDLNIDSIDKMLDKAQSFNPNLIGISMMSYMCQRTYNTISILRRHFAGATIIAGGPHVTANGSSVLEDCHEIDIAVSGEGEEIIKELLFGSELEKIKGIYFRINGQIKWTGHRPFITDLDKLPFPHYEGLDLKPYGNTMPISSSRGCPYQCIFCGAPRLLGKKWRHKSALQMIDEIKYWNDKGWRTFSFNDSNFAVNKKRVNEFCDEIIRQKIDASFIAEGLRADHVNREILSRMRDAGFVHISFGVESGSDRILKNLKKGENRATIESAIAYAVELNYTVNLFFIIGSPGETGTDIEASFELAEKYNISRAFFFNMTPIPGTEFFEWAVEHGFANSLQNKYNEGNFGFSQQAKYGNDMMSAEEMNIWLDKARKLEIKVASSFIPPSNQQTDMLIIKKIARILMDNPDAKIAVWGTGQHSQKAYSCFSSLKDKITLFVDENHQSANFHEFPVVQPSELPDFITDILISSDAWENQMWEKRNIFGRPDLHIHRLYSNNALLENLAGDSVK